MGPPYQKARPHRKEAGHGTQDPRKGSGDGAGHLNILNFFKKVTSPADPPGDQPLVSVIIPTYNRAELLTKRAIPSVLSQTHKNFELIIVSDHCSDETEKKVGMIDDPRVRFYDLPAHSDMPSDARLGWFVRGAGPANYALELAKGQWLTHLDDDDEFTPDHIEVLLSAALKRSLDLVYGLVSVERANSVWKDKGSFPPEEGGVCHNAVLYNAKFKGIKYDTLAWQKRKPSDWLRWEKMISSGARIGFVKRVVGKYYSPKSSLKNIS